MTNVLVTGGAGYIGSHTCKALALAGYTPVTYDNLVYGHEWAVKWGPLETGDILDKARLSQVLEKYQPKAIMHFAAYAYVGESVQNPGKYYRNNTAGALSVLESASDHSINKLAFSSTCATFGAPSKVPIVEDETQSPINPYGASKLMVERMLSDFDIAHGMRSASLRYFNAAGADPDGEIGEDHNPETHLIPLVLDAACGLRPAITVFGHAYDTLEGPCIRYYVHVCELADAHVLALRALEDGASSLAVNLGNGHGFSVKEVIDTAQRVTGRSIPVEYGPRREGGPPALVGDATTACNLLGWQPRLGALDDIIDTAWKWHYKHFATSRG